MKHRHEVVDEVVLTHHTPTNTHVTHDHKLPRDLMVTHDHLISIHVTWKLIILTALLCATVIAVIILWHRG